MTEKRFAADARSSRDSASELKANLEDCASLTHFLVKEADFFRGLASVSLFGGAFAPADGVQRYRGVAN